MMKKTNKHFVSEIDKQFAAFDASHQKSQAQLDEIAKYKKMNDIRDNPHPAPTEEQDELWD